MRVEYFSDREDALRTAGTRIVLKCSLAASQPSAVLGSRRGLFTVGVKESGRMFVVSQDTASVAEFELGGVKKMAASAAASVAVGCTSIESGEGRGEIDLQAALLLRCVSNLTKNFLHLEHCIFLLGCDLLRVLRAKYCL